MNALHSFPTLIGGNSAEPASDELTFRQVVFAPALLTLIMLAIAGVTCTMAAVNPVALIFPYFFYGVSFSGIAVLIYVFIEVAKLAPRGVDKPLKIVLASVRSRAAFLVLPMLVFPSFMVGFNAAKVCIPFLVGYSWDGFLINLDRRIFGDDAWRIAHHLFGTWSKPTLEWLYSTGWGAVFTYSATLVVLYARPRRIAIFYTTMFLTWLLGGWLAAYCFSAVGPVFVPLFHPEFAKGFDPLRAWLAANLDPHGSIRLTQSYLSLAIHNHRAVKGSGISAMPSMHLGAIAVYVFASRGTKWVIPAAAFWVLIFVASGYFGYHYWVDGIAAAAIAALCYSGAAIFFRVPAPAPSESTLLPA